MPIELAEVTLLRIIRKLGEIDLRPTNLDFFMQKISDVPLSTTTSYIEGKISRKQIKEALLLERSKEIGLRNGKPLETLNVSDIEWLKFASGELDIFRWKNQKCSFCLGNLSTNHLLTCVETKKVREEIENRVGEKAEIALTDPTVFNGLRKDECLKVGRAVV